MRHFILFVLFLSAFSGTSPAFARGELPESITAELDDLSSRHEKVDFLLKKAEENGFNDPVLSVKLAEKARDYAEKIENDTLVMKCTYFIGTAYINQGFYRLALKIQSSGLEMALAQGDIRWEARFRNDLGIIHDFLGNWNAALAEYYNALKIFYSLQDSRGIANTLNNIGLVKLRSKQYSTADSFFTVAMQMGQSLRDEAIQAMALSNKGMLHIEVKQFRQALEAYTRVLKLDLAAGTRNYTYIASDYSNLANCYLGLKQYDTAWHFEMMGLRMKKQTNNQRGISTSFAGLAEILSAKGQQAEALVYLDSALKWAQITQDPGLIAETYSSKADMLYKLGNYQEAYLAMANHMRYSDSLYDHENVSLGIRLEKEFEAERIDMQVDLLNAQLENQKQERFYLILCAVLFFLLSIILIVQSRINASRNRVLAQKQENLDHALGELTEKNREIRKQRDVLEDALEVKSRFLATVSHEIRTPLNVILGLSEILKKESLSQSQMNSVMVLNNASLQLIALVTSILDLNKLESGMLEVNNSEYDLVQCLHGISRGYDLQIREKGLQFDFKMDKNLPERVFGDRLKLEQVLNNILNNAIKFTDHGKISLGISLRERKNGEHLIRFEIQDSGIGIDVNDQEVIFEPFQQIVKKHKFYGGTGLGLSISSSLVNMMGGELKVTSEPGKGSSFFFELPFREVAQTNEESQEAKNIDFSLWGNDRHILVAEDYPQNILLLKMILGKTPCHYDWVVNGKEALDAAREKKYDLILMDMHMPEMDGRTASVEIRKLEGYEKTPIMALTATDKSEIESLDEGIFDSVLFKPYLPEDLYSKMDEFLR